MIRIENLSKKYDKENVLENLNCTIKDSSIYGLVLPKSLIEIGNDAFSQNNLTSINIPSNVQIIGDSAFSSNYSLAEVTLNEGIEKIGRNAFNGSNRLSGEITIPSSVMEIGDNAFGNNLSKVNILGKKSSNDFDKFGNNPFGYFAEIVYELPKVELPELPIIFDVSVEDGDAVTKYDVFKINGINYTIDNNDDGTYNLRLVFNGMVNLSGEIDYGKVYSMWYRLYDENNNLIYVNSLNLDSECYGRFIEHEIYINNLSIDNLRLELFVQ